MKITIIRDELTGNTYAYDSDTEKKIEGIKNMQISEQRGKAIVHLEITNPWLEITLSRTKKQPRAIPVGYLGC